PSRPAWAERDGVRAFAWETTTTTAGETFLSPTTVRTSCITTTVTERLRMSARGLESLDQEKLGAPGVRLLTTTATVISLGWWPITWTLTCLLRRPPQSGPLACARHFLSW